MFQFGGGEWENFGEMMECARGLMAKYDQQCMMSNCLLAQVIPECVSSEESISEVRVFPRGDTWIWERKRPSAFT